MIYGGKILCFCLILLISGLVGCSTEEKFVKYEDKEHDFSFVYSNIFKEENKEKDKFALVDGDDNVIIFMINENPTSDDVLELGKEQAYLDLSTQMRNKEDIDKQVKIVKTKTNDWYTYAIEFSGEGAKSIVSGTFCEGKSIMVVLVTKDNDYERNKEEYMRVVGSFEC
ncbi:MAG: hypothetical protein U9O94_02890 [Nanoarchaeota archaeon]|nr:hypothetical protein [Nanoarchaeota archaeon]